MSAENPTVTSAPPLVMAPGFNEAALDERGEHRSAETTAHHGTHCFNEAALDERGELASLPHGGAVDGFASTKPRSMSAENG